MTTRRTFKKFSGYTKKQTVAFVKMKIRTNKLWRKQALLAIYNLQEKTEKQNTVTNLKNGVGFNAYDAPYFSELAKKLKRTGDLSKNDMIRMKGLDRYAIQLLRICDRTKMEIALNKYFDDNTLAPNWTNTEDYGLNRICSDNYNKKYSNNCVMVLVGDAR